MIIISDIYLLEAADIRLKYLDILKKLNNKENNYHNFYNDKNAQLKELEYFKNIAPKNFNHDNVEIAQKELDEFLDHIEKISSQSDFIINKLIQELQDIILKSEKLAEKIKLKYPNIKEEDYQSQILNYLIKRNIS